MDGGPKGPNQWNPETPGDNAAFDAYMRRLALVRDEDFVDFNAVNIEVPRVRKLGPNAGPEERLEQIAEAYAAFLAEHHNKTRRICQFRSHTPKDAREYVRRHPKHETNPPWEV